VGYSSGDPVNRDATPQDNDRQLIARCISGDREASEIFVRRFSDLVYRCAQYALNINHIAFTRDDIEDFHNTVFLKLFERQCKKLRQYKGKNGCSLATWIRIVTVRVVLNHLRKKGIDTMARQKWRIPFEDLTQSGGNDTEVWTQLERSEQVRLIRDGIQNLSPRDRLFLKLHFKQGFTVAEISEIMKLSIQNVHTMKHRSIKRLISNITNFEKI